MIIVIIIIILLCCVNTSSASDNAYYDAYDYDYDYHGTYYPRLFCYFCYCHVLTVTL